MNSASFSEIYSDDFESSMMAGTSPSVVDTVVGFQLCQCHNSGPNCCMNNNNNDSLGQLTEYHWENLTLTSGGRKDSSNSSKRLDNNNAAPTSLLSSAPIVLSQNFQHLKRITSQQKAENREKENFMDIGNDDTDMQPFVIDPLFININDPHSSTGMMAQQGENTSTFTTVDGQLACQTTTEEEFCNNNNSNATAQCLSSGRNSFSSSHSIRQTHDDVPPLLFDENFAFGLSTQRTSDNIDNGFKTRNNANSNSFAVPQFASSMSTPFPSRRSSIHHVPLAVPSLSTPDSVIASPSSMSAYMTTASSTNGNISFFRKQTRSMSQPCIFYPLNNTTGFDSSHAISPSLLVSNFEEVNNSNNSNPNNFACNDRMMSVMLNGEDGSASSSCNSRCNPYECDYHNGGEEQQQYAFSKRRMSTPAALSRPVISNVAPKVLQFIQEDPSKQLSSSSNESNNSFKQSNVIFPNCYDLDNNSMLYYDEDLPSSNNESEKSNFAQRPSRRHSAASGTVSNGIFSCPWPQCGKEFTRFYNLKSHYRCHSGERPFKCEYCPSTFARNHDLKRHERKHTGVKPFQCEGCKKTFSRNDAMNRHIRISNCAPLSVNAAPQSNQMFHHSHSHAHSAHSSSEQLATIMEK